MKAKSKIKASPDVLEDIKTDEWLRRTYAVSFTFLPYDGGKRILDVGQVIDFADPRERRVNTGLQVQYLRFGAIADIPATDRDPAGNHRYPKTPEWYLAHNPGRADNLVLDPRSSQHMILNPSLEGFGVYDQDRCKLPTPTLDAAISWGGSIPSVWSPTGQLGSPQLRLWIESESEAAVEKFNPYSGLGRYVELKSDLLPSIWREIGIDQTPMDPARYGTAMSWLYNSNPRRVFISLDSFADPVPPSHEKWLLADAQADVRDKRRIPACTHTLVDQGLAYMVNIIDRVPINGARVLDGIPPIS